MYYWNVVKMLIVIRGSRGLGIGGPDTPTFRMEEHKAVDFLRNNGFEPLDKHRATNVGSSSDC